MWTSERTHARTGAVVLGLGNPLMGDDGVGLAALARLAEGWQLGGDVELVDGGTWGMSLLPTLEGAAAVVLLDAIHVDAAPGTPVRLEGDAVPAALALKVSPHQIDLREVLAVMRDLARDGMTMVVVTHEMAFAREAASRIIFLDLGSIVETGAPEAFFSAPRSERARQFLLRYANAPSNAARNSP